MCFAEWNKGHDVVSLFVLLLEANVSENWCSDRWDDEDTDENPDHDWGLSGSFNNIVCCEHTSNRAKERESGDPERILNVEEAIEEVDKAYIL